MSDNIILVGYFIVVSQVILIPILGLIFIGIRNERKITELLLKDAIKALRMVGITRGRHL